MNNNPLVGYKAFDFFYRLLEGLKSRGDKLTLSQGEGYIFDIEFNNSLNYVKSILDYYEFEYSVFTREG